MPYLRRPDDFPSAVWVKRNAPGGEGFERGEYVIRPRAGDCQPAERNIGLWQGFQAAILNMTGRWGVLSENTATWSVPSLF